MNKLELALQYAAGGIPVIPLHTPTGNVHKPCSCNKADCKSIGKHPRIKKNIEGATTDEAQVRQWWGWWPDANIGIATGEPMGAFVLDIDPHNGGDATFNRYIERYGPFDAPVAKTGGDGYHFFFAMPGFDVRNTQSSSAYPSYLGAGIDLRGTGGYVVAPGSVHVSGKTYEWMKEKNGHWPDAPQWLLDLIRSKGGKALKPVNLAATGEQILSGARHPQLLRWAAQMRHNGLSEAAILAGLKIENETRCNPPKEDSEIARIAAWAASKQPGDILTEVEAAIYADQASIDEIEGRIEIDVTEGHLPKINALTWAAIKQNNNPPVLFNYGMVLSRAIRRPDGGALLQQVTPESLRHEVAKWANWYGWGKKGDVLVKKPAKPPIDIMKDVLVSREWHVPELTAIANVPVFGPSGSLLTEPGYDHESGILYAPLKGFEALPVPEEITEDMLWDARSFILDELLCDFPFASNADRDNAIALMLQPFVREMITGPVPLHMFEASMAGSGKGLLLHTCLYPALGHDYALSPMPGTEEEWRKTITAQLMAGNQAFLIDNVNYKLDSGALANAITSLTWSDRLLGGSTMVRAKMRLIWAATGNNPTVSAEINRRRIPTRLAPTTDRPEDRTGFKHDDLKGFLDENRPRAVQCCHILIKYWLQNGRPAPSIRPLGSFERWSHVLGGILHAAGLTDFLANYRAYQEQADVERVALACFCATAHDWLEREGKHRAATRELLPIGERVEGLEINGLTDGARARSFGKWLQANKDVYVSYSEPDGDRLHTRTFAVRRRALLRGELTWAVDLIEEKTEESR